MPNQNKKNMFVVNQSKNKLFKMNNKNVVEAVDVKNAVMFSLNAEASAVAAAFSAISVACLSASWGLSWFH